MVTREYLAPGTRVVFGYYHSFNTRSRAYREKTGTVVRTVKHRKGTFYDQPMVVVRFDGNKSDSTVEMSRLEIAKLDAHKLVETYRGIPIKISEFTGEYHTYVNERIKPYIAVPLKTADLDDMKRQIDELLDKDYRKHGKSGRQKA